MGFVSFCPNILFRPEQDMMVYNISINPVQVNIQRADDVYLPYGIFVRWNCPASIIGLIGKCGPANIDHFDPKKSVIGPILGVFLLL
jgi:hypothetical protein